MLGAGELSFTTIGDDLPLEFGGQLSALGLFANVRVKGLELGDPENVLNPYNPRTRATVYFADTGRPLITSCPMFRVAYEIPLGDGWYGRDLAFPVLFDDCWRSTDLLGQRVRFKVEVIDGCGAYATDEHVVTLQPHPDKDYPNHQPGCPP